MDDFNSLQDFVDYIDRRSKLLNNDLKIITLAKISKGSSAFS